MAQLDWTAIRRMPPFRGIDSEATFAALRSVATVQRVDRDITLVKEGDRPRSLYVVAEGSVELFGCHNGHSATFEIKDALVTLLLEAIIGNAVALQSARTVSPCCAVAFPAQAVRHAFKSDAGFARAIAEDLAARHRNIICALKDEKLRNGAERLANWILKVHLLQGTTGCVDINFHKRMLASQLNMAPENLSRNLALLGKHGIRSTGRRIYVEDTGALERFAKPNALIDL